MKNWMAWGMVVMLFYGFAAGPLAQEQDPQRPIWTYKDPWYQPTSPGMDWLMATATERAKWTWLKDEEIFPITGPMAPKAEASLKKVPVLKLTLAEAEAFTGKRLTTPRGKLPHLIRSIYLNEGTGRFT